MITRDVFTFQLKLYTEFKKCRHNTNEVTNFCFNPIKISPDNYSRVKNNNSKYSLAL